MSAQRRPAGPALVAAAPWGPPPQRPPSSIGKVVAYALRRIGSEWPTSGWSGDKERVQKAIWPGYELVKMTIEPEP